MFNYATKYINSQSYKVFLKSAFILFLFSLFFPVRKVILTPISYLTGDFSDFTTISLYLSDIILLILAISCYFSYKSSIWLKIKSFIKKDFILVLFISLIIISFLFNLGLNIKLNIYILIKWLELIVAYETAKVLFEQNVIKDLFLKGFVWFSGIQSILCLYQFTSQHSLGLFKLGEQHLSPYILGVAKIVSGGTTYIRGAGTFPHPNPLSVFLVLGVLIGLYLVVTLKDRKQRLFYSFLAFLNILGVTLTFSRGAYLSLAIGLLLFFGYLFIQKVNLKFTIKACGVTIISIIICFFLYKPFLTSRATFSDQATIDRRAYDVGGLNMIKKNPIFGVGMGESLLHMEQALGKKLEPWDKQPPHNYFILVAAELGIPTMLILTWLFLSHVWQLIKKLKSENNFSHATNYLLLFTCLIVILTLMQFDHYFYTLQQTQFLLWIILALCASETKNPRVGD